MSPVESPDASSAAPSAASAGASPSASPSTSPGASSGTPRGSTLGDLGEAGILSEVFARLDATSGPDHGVLVGPGDDTALLAAPGGSVLATTDSMVRDRDWRDDWSTPQDVGAKCVVQNLADLAAMGGVGTGLLVSLIAPGSLEAGWAFGLVDGIADAAGAAGVPVVGGDLSSSAEGTVVVSITALGALPGGAAVLRSGARSGDVLAVSGSLGASAAGLELLRREAEGRWPEPAAADLAAALVGYHCRPDPDLTQGPRAAAAGASAMIDVSDGLGRDGGRIAAASRVRLELDEEAVLAAAARLEPVLGADEALGCVLTGGEEHSLLATFAPTDLPSGWVAIGRVLDLPEGERPGVWWRGERLDAGGWDHFGG